MRLFSQGRAKISYVSLPRPVALFHLATLNEVVLPGNLLVRYQQVVTPGFRWEDFVCDPVHDEAAVLQAKYDIMALALAGFLIVNGGQFRVRVFQDNASSVLPYLQILEALDSKLDLTRFCDLVPTGEPTVLSQYCITNAMKLAKLMGQYGEGIEIVSEQVAHFPDPFLAMLTTDSPSQV